MRIVDRPAPSSETRDGVAVRASDGLVVPAPAEAGTTIETPSVEIASTSAMAKERRKRTTSELTAGRERRCRAGGSDAG